MKMRIEEDHTRPEIKKIAAICDTFGIPHKIGRDEVIVPDLGTFCWDDQPDVVEGIVYEHRLGSDLIDDIKDVEEMLHKHAEWLASVERKESIIETLFKKWGDAGDEYAGFVAWCWDLREETLDNLSAINFGELPGQVANYVTMQDKYRGEDFEAAAKEWIDWHEEELVQAIEESLEDE